ncbi:O-antigen ligase family protein [Parabacteroides goldsteinii]|uniref:O-antigen ligase family protein n=2 Tax=Parabacteroides TaxID=375288 RepID=UPI001CC9F1BB|nr:O-antigen ligase family protein [Parabacteroides goldsteinii]UBD75668.1 O-antigen ligase family protein [Parabacteroides goldsteinii]
MKYRQHISYSLLAISGIFLLCTVFATDTGLANGLVIGKVLWFHLAMLLLAACSLVAAVLTKPAKPFVFSIADGLVLVLAAIVALTYNRQLDPEPEKMLFGGQLVVLWFLLRFILTGWPQLQLFFLAVVVATGGIEAVSGMRQLHGFEGSNHSLFKLTGDFYNPGPYSGYLAIVLPVCLWMILEWGKEKRVHSHASLRYLGWIGLLAIIVVLPAGMSRTAWIAAAVSCGWVYWVQRIGWEKTKRYMNGNRTLTIVSSILILISIAGALAGIYLLKKDSANGRLLLWKVTGQAIREQPWTGTGTGSFPAAYAEAQAEYFTSGKASETEMLVAGCPEYGFNEFLQIGLEQGLVGLMVFVLLLSYSLFRRVKNRQAGAAGGILALMVFSLASYPLQLPEFWVVLVVLMGVANSNTPVDADISVDANTPPTPSREGRKILSVAMIGVLAICCGWIFRQQKGYYEGYKKWNTLKMLYNSKAYEAAGEGYEELVPLMGHKPELLFEAAQCLSKSERFEEANRLLERAMKLSGDPMIHYMAAKNEQSMGNYQKAENLLLHAIDMLPERIYPYYLLTKLYSEPGFFQKDKFLKAANAVLEKEPKVKSTAIREMREEVKILIQNRK